MTIILNEKEDIPAIINDGFFPDVEPEVFKDTQRIADSVSNQVMRAKLITAIKKVRNDLEAYKTAQLNAGYMSLMEVPSDHIDNQSIVVSDYFDAVFSYAKAGILDVYQDTDTTVIDDDNLDLKTVSVDNYRRDGFEAIRRILDQPRATIELI